MLVNKIFEYVLYNCIIRCGGTIIYSSIGRARVNGRLEMTRSLGDVELKRFGVIAEPEIHKMQVNQVNINVKDSLFNIDIILHF